MEDIPVPATKKSQSNLIGFFLVRLCKDLENKGFCEKKIIHMTS
jgi:hypothetical protein